MRRALGLLLLLLQFAVQAATPQLRFIALDVGEGDALLLQQGPHGLLIDTGHFGMTQRVLQRLQHYGIESLDGIILTNLRPERAGGYFMLREHYPDLTIYHNDHQLPDNVAPASARWIYQGLQQDQHSVSLKQGDSVQWQDVAINVLWPQQAEGNDINHNSLVLQISVAGRTALVMSDVDSDVEAQLLQRGLLPAKVDVLMVGYHGAASASSVPFLNAVQPHYAVISVNANNIRGFPSPQVLSRLQRVSSTVLRTDQQGDVCLQLNSKEIKTCH